VNARLDQATRNLEGFLSRVVTSADLVAGRAAYPAYNKTLRGLAARYSAPFVPTVEAFAALSPNNDYLGNLRSAASLLEARELGLGFEACTITTYRACGSRAWGYLVGDVSFLDTVRGAKIRAFRHNILYPDTSRAVTVDGHMIAIAAGERLTMKEAAAFLAKTPRLYQRIEDDVRRLARGYRLPIPALQASLWTARKRSLGIVFSDQLRLFDEGTIWDTPIEAVDVLPYNKRHPAP